MPSSLLRASDKRRELEKLKDDAAKSVSANIDRTPPTFGIMEPEIDENSFYESISKILEELTGNPEKAREIFGERIEPALYEPVDIDESLARTVGGNLGVMPQIEQLVGRSNELITDEALKRIEKQIPGSAGMRGQASKNASSLLAGELPFDDVMDIVRQRSELSNALGFTGAGKQATLRDLGMARLDAMNTGQSMYERLVSAAEQVDPVGRQMLPQQQMLTPDTRLAADLDQAQLMQQSQQSANNLAAQADPVQRGLFTLDVYGRQDVPTPYQYNPFSMSPFGAQSYTNYLQGSGFNIPT